jgi:hypothetical protein
VAIDFDVKVLVRLDFTPHRNSPFMMLTGSDANQMAYLTE